MVASYSDCARVRLYGDVMKRLFLFPFLFNVLIFVSLTRTVPHVRLMGVKP